MDFADHALIICQMILLTLFKCESLFHMVKHFVRNVCTFYIKFHMQRVQLKIANRYSSRIEISLRAGSRLASSRNF